MKTRPLAIAPSQRTDDDVYTPAQQRARRNVYETESAITAGREALQHAREVLERAAEEIKRYEARYDGTRTETFGATDPLSNRADVLNWALGYIASSILGNARLDLIADAQSKLRVCAARARDAVE